MKQKTLDEGQEFWSWNILIWCCFPFPGASAHFILEWSQTTQMFLTVSLHWWSLVALMFTRTSGFTCNLLCIKSFTCKFHYVPASCWRQVVSSKAPPSPRRVFTKAQTRYGVGEAQSLLPSSDWRGHWFIGTFLFCKSKGYLISKQFIVYN